MSKFHENNCKNCKFLGQNEEEKVDYYCCESHINFDNSPLLVLKRGENYETLIFLNCAFSPYSYFESRIPTGNHLQCAKLASKNKFVDKCKIDDLIQNIKS